MSLLLQKRSTFPYSQCIERCGLDLREKREYRTDEHLFHVVQLQHLVELIDTNTHELRATGLPTSSYSELESRLEFARHQLEPESHNVELVVFQYNSVQLFLCQAVIFEQQAPLDPTNQERMVHSGLCATRSLLDFYLSLPLHAERAFNNSEWIQLAFAITVGARLSVFARRTRAMSSGPHQNIQTLLPLSQLLRRVSLRLGALAAFRDGPEGGKDTFRGFEKRVHRMQDWFERCSASSVFPRSASVCGGGGGEGETVRPAGAPFGASVRGPQQVSVSDPTCCLGSNDYDPANFVLGSASLASAAHLNAPPTVTSTFGASALDGRSSLDTALAEADMDTFTMPGFSYHGDEGVPPSAGFDHPGIIYDPAAGTGTGDSCSWLADLDDTFNTW